MATDVQVPALGESITEGTLAQWLKKPGEAVAADEPIASLETDKVSVEVPSPIAGVLTEQLGARKATRSRSVRRSRGSTRGAAASATPAEAAAAAHDQSSWSGREPQLRGTEHAPEPAPATAEASAGDDHITTLSPAVRRAVLEYHVDPTKIRGTGKDGRLTKDDVIAAAQARRRLRPQPKGTGACRSGCTRAAGEAGPPSPASGAKSASR